MLEPSLLSLFLVGLFGGLHCAGMCGGIVSAMGIAGHARPVGPARNPGGLARPRSDAARMLRLLAYNGGRISSYILAGAIVGGIGSSAFLMSRVLPVQQFVFVLANLTLIVLGLYVSGAIRSIAPIEAAGRGLWRAVGPAAARAMRGDTARDAWVAGMLWGFVPCGMVYAGLVAALTSASAIDGALLMAAFGLGTLPNLLALGWSAGRVTGWLRNRWIKAGAGILIIVFGVMGLLRLDPTEHIKAAIAYCF
ncbi:MAG: sulfite exporter TauE/SafE family protein [Burkholderiaceae bacterium]|nr:sulfite exporter TauE/SafE family protein [Burkholderiaceae bacterium]MEB2320110.1 sulfite exporter TauE/SafE family protein [Pseudomonadota bacterium]